MGIALAITIPIVVLIVLFLSFWFHYVKQKQDHERKVLALQKGLPLPPEPVTAGPRSKALLLIAVLIPVLGALIGLGFTIWAWSSPSIPLPVKWDITGIAFLAAGWTACVIVSTTAVIVVVNSEITAARQNPVVPMKSPESHNP